MLENAWGLALLNPEEQRTKIFKGVLNKQQIIVTYISVFNIRQIIVTYNIHISLHCWRRIFPYFQSSAIEIYQPHSPLMLDHYKRFLHSLGIQIQMRKAITFCEKGHGSVTLFNYSSATTKGVLKKIPVLRNSCSVKLSVIFVVVILEKYM